MWTYYLRSLKSVLECVCFAKLYKIEGLDMNIGRMGALKIIFLEASKHKALLSTRNVLRARFEISLATSILRSD